MCIDQLSLLSEMLVLRECVSLNLVPGVLSLRGKERTLGTKLRFSGLQCQLNIRRPLFGRGWCKGQGVVKRSRGKRRRMGV